MSSQDIAKKYLKVLVGFLVAVSLLVGLFPLRESYAAPKEGKSDDNGIIHIFAFTGSDAILVESNGEFAMIDSGEDNDYPLGEDDRYPLRNGIIKGNGKEEQVIQYMKEQGVNSENLKVYIGTHAHSDHIGSADETINEFTPDYVYTPLYDDSYITDESRLWDNQYVYDNLIAAAEESNAVLIQEPTKEERTIQLGSLTLQIENYHEIDSDFKTSDANDYCWGIKVTDGVNTAFLAGDINNNTGSEDELSKTLGHVDALKMGHHGLSGSNTVSYIESLSPNIAVITGNKNKLSDATADALFSFKTNVITASDAVAENQETIRLSFTGNGITTNIPDKNLQIQFRERQSSPYMTAYSNYEPIVLNGWKQVGKYWYWFENSNIATENSWIKTSGRWYFLQENARMATGWAQVGGVWYYLDSSGAMQTGWKKIKGVWYYLNGSGAMQTGWLKTGGKWYYLNDNGAMATGWKQVGKTWYYLNSSGAMQTGWEKVDGKWYYLDSSGAMKSNCWIGNYYVESNGAMATNKWIGNYYVGSDGKWIDSRFRPLAEKLN